MGGSDLDGSRTEVFFHVFVCNDGDFSVPEGELYRFPYYGNISFVVGIDGYRGIAQHGFGACCGKLDKARAVGERIAEFPESAFFCFVFHFGVGKSGAAFDAHVGNTVSAVYESFVIEYLEYVSDRTAQIFVHGEGFAAPVAAAAERTQLFFYSSAVFIFPVPGELKEFFAAHPSFFESLSAHFFGDLEFCCNGRMIGAGQP